MGGVGDKINCVVAFYRLYVVLPFPASPPAIGVPLCSNVCVVRLRVCSASAGAQSTTTCALLREGTQGSANHDLFCIFQVHRRPPPISACRSACYSVAASALPFALPAMVVYIGGLCSSSSSTITTHGSASVQRDGGGQV